MPNTVRHDYDRLAPVYETRWSHYVDSSLRSVMDAVRLSGEEHVLDVASGTGVLEAALLDRWPGLRVVGADLSGGMLGHAVRKGLPDGRVSWVQADAHRLPLRDGRFDLAICANSFHCFRGPGPALREFARVLKPGGRLVLIDWCDDYVNCRLCSAWLHLTDPAFHRSYTVDACRGLLRGAGFEVESAERFRISWLWGLMRFQARRA